MKNRTPVAVTSRSFSKHPDLRAELLDQYQNVTFNDQGLSLEGDGLVNFLQGHKKAIIALESIDATVLEKLPSLKVISKYGVGLDMIDIEAMQKHEVSLGWSGGVNRRSVSELVISFAISLLRHVPAANSEVRLGTWRPHMGRYLSERTVGIVGCGHIGKDLVPILNAFGCTVLAHDILDFSDFYSTNRVEAVDLEGLLRRSEVVTIHLPLDETTRNILTAERLALMPATAILINAARGGLVDEKALKTMLMDGRLAGAAFDVFAVEPPLDSELLSLPNFLATPHIGGSAEEAILAMGRAAIGGLENNAVPTSGIY
ncbi:MAG: phosphoglycerate dehydrogenase [Rhodospirillaceae bacterium]|mgnify:FL=1|nr:phosphoglycerate dehydrogenase [Rhodospirillaceae bacterium]MBT5242890.1 phosphoglycerate dehydrogenase [Rhodospirillaceae bacterium]MBT5563114.1 phosphoglycerate dehydrogenase [Rhodospirillaceae bacterium]MBT6243429.1 phosphoglycerate dehydrogenase [Rhodospirillaceae bacterium]